MECGRNNAEDFRGVACGRALEREVGVTLQTDLANILPGEHPGVGGAMRFMTGSATLKANGGVLEGEGAADLRVALEASRFVGGCELHHARTEASVRVVAIDARHGVLHQAVGERLLKGRPDGQMASGAELIDVGRLARDESEGPVGVNLVAGGASNLILGVATRDAAHLGGLVQMASEADAVGFGWSES
jgi:hypothetical protein